MGQSNIKGDIAELEVARVFLEKGYRVSMPFGDDAPYDLVIEKEGIFKRIQVKYSEESKGVIRAQIISSTGISYKDSCDCVVIYSPGYGCFMVDIQGFDKTAIRLRVSPTKNKQKLNIQLAEDFKIS